MHTVTNLESKVTENGIVQHGQSFFSILMWRLNVIKFKKKIKLKPKIYNYLGISLLQ